LDIRFASENHIWVNDVDFGSIIREEAAGLGASQVGALPAVRAALLERQRQFAQVARFGG
jgi:cytidylate kinase